MIDSTKITILLCLTILVTSILVMSYNEYVNRFSIIATQDNGIYIFDKKSATLNRCENGHCTAIPTQFPQNPLFQIGSNNKSNQQQYATNVTPNQTQLMQNPNINQIPSNAQNVSYIPQSNGVPQVAVVNQGNNV
ncbi:MAG: hypothetical protein IJ848_02560 [Alphaproteobacteria bacterium]|nr:hypothetical protein [Alphaproteobacteria bacterium]